MNKFMLFVFNGDPMCFIHVLLNVLDMKERGHDAGVVIEGAAVRLLPDLVQEKHPLHALWEKTKAAGLITGVCKACSRKLGTIDSATAQGLVLLEDIGGHPSIARYRQAGYEVIIF